MAQDIKFNQIRIPELFKDKSRSLLLLLLPFFLFLVLHRSSNTHSYLWGYSGDDFRVPAELLVAQGAGF